MNQRTRRRENKLAISNAIPLFKNPGSFRIILAANGEKHSVRDKDGYFVMVAAPTGLHTLPTSPHASHRLQIFPHAITGHDVPTVFTSECGLSVSHAALALVNTPGHISVNTRKNINGRDVYVRKR
jgi:hypothetical protein